jgi:hypothetical protein
MAIWYIIWPFGNLVVFGYNFRRFGILYQEKSGNPVQKRSHELVEPIGCIYKSGAARW